MNHGIRGTRGRKSKGRKRNFKPAVFIQFHAAADTREIVALAITAASRFVAATTPKGIPVIGKPVASAAKRLTMKCMFITAPMNTTS